MFNKTASDLKWRQDLSSVTIQLEIKRTTLKKIDITVGRRFIKVTCSDKNYTKVIDFEGEVNIDGKP